MSANLYTHLQRGFNLRPQRAAMVLPDGFRISYRTLDAAAAQVANALIGAGARRGDRVAAQIEKSAIGVALYLGCLRAGLVYLPLNTGYQKSELAYFIGNARPSVIVCDPSKAALMNEISPDARVFTMDADGEGSLKAAGRLEAKTFDTVKVKGHELAAILYTSGTTGRSKGAMITHGNLVANARALVKAWGFSADDVLLHMLPTYHVHGLFVALHCALSSGATMHFWPKFEARAAMHLLPKSSVMMGVPTFYTRLLQEAAFDVRIAKKVRLFVSGSAPLLAETHQEFSARTGQAILERYGMTETGMITSNPLKGARLADTVGKPLSGNQVRVVDDAGTPLKPGEIGSIQTKGAHVFPGYWEMPEKNAEEFTSDGFFKTGDMGEWLPNGYLRIVGREKDLIITGGLNVYPKEIEEAIDAMDGVLESAVVGVPHPDFGEAVTAVVVSKTDAALDAAQIIRAIKENMANFKVPKRVVLVEALPRNAMGKVQKNVLRARLVAGEL